MSGINLLRFERLSDIMRALNGNMRWILRAEIEMSNSPHGRSTVSAILLMKLIRFHVNVSSEFMELRNTYF